MIFIVYLIQHKFYNIAWTLIQSFPMYESETMNEYDFSSMNNNFNSTSPLLIDIYYHHQSY